jgi:2'-5' RNA ligase
MFEKPTYIVLKIPEPLSSVIKNIRSRFDADRGTLPVEITIAGSSGLGTICPGQDTDKVFKEIDEIAARFNPFRTSFGKVKKFPGTDIFFFELSNRNAFNKIHRAFACSGIKFVRNDFPFVPHCTLKLLGKATEKEIKELLTVIPPRQKFVIDILAVYMYEDIEAKLVHEAKLGRDE